MADTEPLRVTPPVESDGVSYRGIVWFVVILMATAVFCHLLMWGVFELIDYRVGRAEVARAPLATAPVNPSIKDGRVLAGSDAPPLPIAPLVNEPVVLAEFRTREESALSTYGWVDQGAGIVRLPIDRAKDLVIERGLPTRPGAPASSLTAAVPAPAKAPPPPATGPAVGHGGH
jgi:hypothetical protein